MTKRSKQKPVSRNEIQSSDWSGLFKELQEESPRGGVLVGVAFLDELLHQLLRAYFIDEKSTEQGLFGNLNAPLQSLSSRIKLAFALGLISQADAHDLDILRDIRNQFAHAIHGLTLDDPYIASQTEELICVQFLPWKDIDVGGRILFCISFLASRVKLTALSTDHRTKHPDTRVST